MGGQTAQWKNSSGHTGRRDLNFPFSMDVSCGEAESLSLPKLDRANALEELYRTHPGAIHMKRIARTLIWWPGLDKEIEQQVHSCVECQMNLLSPPSFPLQLWRWPTRPWPRLHADFADLLWAVCSWFW